jgi:dephospho-CoA kinase
MRTFAVGLTGGIGSGKSAVSELFASHGVPVIDSDQIAHDLLEKDKSVIRAVTDHFGLSALKDGVSNRSYLREQVFKNPQEREWLEDLLHPLIVDIIKEQHQQLRSPYCLIDIPLLKPSMEMMDTLDRILVIEASEEVRVARIKKRNNLSDAMIHQIMATQISETERRAMADDIISNNQTMAELEKVVSLLHQQYLSIALSANE